MRIKKSERANSKPRVNEMDPQPCKKANPRLYTITEPNTVIGFLCQSCCLQDVATVLRLHISGSKLYPWMAVEFPTISDSGMLSDDLPTPNIQQDSPIVHRSYPVSPIVHRRFPVRPFLHRSYPVGLILHRRYPVSPALHRSFPVHPFLHRSYPVSPIVHRSFPVSQSYTGAILLAQSYTGAFLFVHSYIGAILLD